MFRLIIIIGILTIYFKIGYSLKCPTCVNNDCAATNIPSLECNRHIPNLPYGYVRTFESTHFACANLAYKEGDKTTLRQQCLLYSPTFDLCAEIKSSLESTVQLKFCEITTTNDEFKEIEKQREKKPIKGYNPEITTDDPKTTSDEPEITTDGPETSTDEPEATTDDTETTTPTVITLSTTKTTEATTITTEMTTVATENTTDGSSNNFATSTTTVLLLILLIMQKI